MECLMRVGKLSANSIAEKHYKPTLDLMEGELLYANYFRIWFM